MEKKRFKMYKKGKQWLVAPIVFMGLLGIIGAAEGTTAYADELASSSPTEYVPADVPQETVVAEDQAQPDNTVIVPENNNPAEVTPPVSNPVEDNQVEEPAVDPIEDPANETETPTVDPSEESSGEAEKPAPSEDETTSEGKEEAAADEDKPEATEETADASKVVEEKPAASTDKKPVAATASTDKVVKKAAAPEKAQPKATAAPAKEKEKAAEPEPQATVEIYRVYNPNSGEHLHTMNANERNFLVNLGWRYEGISMLVTATGQELHRVYNPNSGEHHYTLNVNEVNMLKTAGWRYEGIAWHTPTAGVSVYRVYNPNTRGAGAHHYTMDANERDTLIRAGWRNEGISWYSAGTKALQDIVVDWFYNREGKVTYSMSNRNGPNSYDCSSAVFYALMEATYLPMGSYIGNTDTLFGLEGRIFIPISRNEVAKGDIFVAGKKGNSAGAFGHTGVAVSNSRIIHCNYKDNGISVSEIAGRTGEPCYWYRLIKA